MAFGLISIEWTAPPAAPFVVDRHVGEPVVVGVERRPELVLDAGRRVAAVAHRREAVARAAVRERAAVHVDRGDRRAARVRGVEVEVQAGVVLDERVDLRAADPAGVGVERAGHHHLHVGEQPGGAGLRRHRDRRRRASCCRCRRRRTCSGTPSPSGSPPGRAGGAAALALALPWPASSRSRGSRRRAERPPWSSATAPPLATTPPSARFADGEAALERHAADLAALRRQPRRAPCARSSAGRRDRSSRRWA